MHDNIYLMISSCIFLKIIVHGTPRTRDTSAEPGVSAMAMDSSLTIGEGELNKALEIGLPAIQRAAQRHSCHGGPARPWPL
jgi:hypothetical protein